MYTYYPGKKFPSLSVTGSHCALRCKHCNVKYLQHMVPVETPEKLLKFVKEHEHHLNGFLLSGGSTREGKVPLKRYVKAVRWIRNNTSLLVNVHTGIIDEEDIQYLEDMKPHHISFDVIGSDKVIKNVLGIKRKKEDYFKALNLLDSSNLNYSPHMIIALDFGRVWWEYETIDFIANLKKFSNLVLIALIPTKGTPMQNVEVSEEEIMDVMKYASKKIKGEKLVIGCMRPRKFIRMEKLAVDLNFKGIVLPSLSTINYAKEKGVNIVRKETCCVF